jgi:hypothetical protein
MLSRASATSCSNRRRSTSTAHLGTIDSVHRHDYIDTAKHIAAFRLD